jgi:drug/metabolite transporter (DMT)-like permease
MLGFLFVILASIEFGIDPTVRQLTVREGLTPVESMWIGYVAAFVISMTVVAARGKPFRIRREKACLLTATGMTGSGLCGLLLVWAYQHMPVGCVTVIHFLYPAIVCFACALLFGKKLYPAHYLGSILMVIGLVCISNDRLTGSVPGLLLAFGSAVTYSIYLLVMGSARMEDVPIETLNFYSTTGGLITTTAAWLIQGPSGNISVRTVAILAALTVASEAAAYLNLAGLRRISTTSVAFTCLMEPITSVVCSTIVFHYRFSPVILAGTGIAILAIFLVAYGDTLEQKEKKQAI